MSDILSKFKGLAGSDEINPASRTWQLSVKVNNAQQAAIEGAMKLTGGNKSDAVRLLIDLGWEAIENDGDFMNAVMHKDEVHRILDFGEDMGF